jgi:arsenate reductase
MPVTIYHNPACGTSRNVLGLLRACGEEPVVVEYLKTPPSRDELKDLIGRMGFSARDLLRRKGTPYDELGLGDPSLTEDQLTDAMLAHPILINRPVVVTEKGVKLCRPSDVVLDLLPRAPETDVLKEDGVPLLRDTRLSGDDPALDAALRTAELPTDDLAEPGRTFFTYRTTGGTALGFGGYERLGRDVLVRSVIVLPEARGKGTGRNLLALLLRRAFDEGARTAWLLTTTAPGFFEKAGFRRMPRADAPAAILATREAASLCPVSAVLLARTITL